MSKIFVLIFGIVFSLFASSIEISVIKPIVNSSDIVIEADGVSIAKNKIILTAKTSGILKLFISNNSSVKTGDKIAEIVNKKRDKKLLYLKSKMQLLKSELNLEKIKLQDAKDMYMMGVGSKNNYLSERLAFSQKKELYQTNKVEYEILVLEEKNGVIIANENGFITNLLAQNTYINYGLSLGAFFTQDSFVKLFVDASYANNINEGMGVELFGSYSKSFAVVKNVLFLSSNNLVEVIVEPKVSFPINMQVKANIILKNVSGLYIPKNSIVLVDNKPVVYIIKDSVAHLKFVEIIKDMVDKVLIKNNLPKDTQIALKNAYMLHDNLQVIVK